MVANEDFLEENPDAVPLALLDANVAIGSRSADEKGYGKGCTEGLAMDVGGEDEVAPSGAPPRSPPALSGASGSGISSSPGPSPSSPESSSPSSSLSSCRSPPSVGASSSIAAITSSSISFQSAPDSLSRVEAYLRCCMAHFVKLPL